MCRPVSNLYTMSSFGMIIEMTKEVVTTLNVQISIELAKKCLVSAISENEKNRPFQLSYHMSDA